VAKINRRMKEYRITNFADLMQALKENPEWLEELRRIVLTQELLELPKKFEEFRHRVEERFDVLEKQVQEVKKKLDRDVCSLKGMWLETEVKKHVHSFFSEHLSNVKLVGQKRVNKILSLAIEKGIISKEEREDVLRLDLIVEGTLLSTEEPVFVAVEISYTIAENDVQRAVKMAEILKKATGRKVLPAVVGYRISKKAKKLLTKTERLSILASD
jgi:hypothetical protein